ncbi:MAG: tRNA (adenosine(37)-N6)-threonylcarbamoyltransferase complex ATPase subunit type 1 TsaE [Bermanella sp.]
MNRQHAAPLALNFADEAAMLEWATAAARLLNPGLVIHLIGDLGMGKTTLSRGLIQGLGHGGNVKSPTYTLVEPYELPDITVYHFDLYRLADPEELEFMGVRDYFSPATVCLIEWPEKGQGVLPQADISINITQWQLGRRVSLVAASSNGQAQINSWRAA